MKKLLLLVLATITLSLSANAQDEKFPDGFLDKSLTEAEGYTSWIPEPPEFTGGEFANDFFYYQWGRDMRENEQEAIAAIWDEGVSLEQAFEKTLGIKLSEGEAPEIVLLCQRAVTDVADANRKVKEKYKRIRPFATFKDPSLTPWSDPEEEQTFSYPSGHTARGYMYAMVLTVLDPSLSLKLIGRAQEYALHRIVCGHHWKSDIDAALMLVAGIFPMVVSTDAFQAQLKKAREEYAKLKGASTRIDSPASTRSTNAAIYDMNGRQLNAEPNNGAYIQGGQKYVK